MKRALVIVISTWSVLAVSCGQGEATPSTTASVASTPASTAASTTVAPSTTTAPTTSTTAGPTTTMADATSTSSSTSTTTPTVSECETAFDGLASSDGPVLTYVADGYLWADLGEVTRCIGEVADDLVGVDYEWSPSGDKVLFADGSIVGVNVDRPAVPGADASLGWTRPTGTSTVHVSADGSLHKVGVSSGVDSLLTPILSHDAIAYHPDGTTFAVSGRTEFEQGIFIAANDGSDPRPLAQADLGVVVHEMTFTSDARWLVFVADHTADNFDSGYHLHVTYTEPFEIDGQLTLGSEFEGSNTLFVSSSRIDTVVVPSFGSGVGASPDGIAAARGECGPERKAIFVNEVYDAVALSDRPSKPVGFLSSGPDEHRIVVAESDDGCNGPWDLIEVTVALEDASITATAPIATAVDAAAVHDILPTVDITLSGVVIEPFA